MNGLWHTVPYGLLHGSLSSYSDVLSSGGYRNNPWGTLMSWEWSIRLLRFSIYILCMCLRLLRLLIACMCGVFFSVCVLLVLLLESLMLGVLLCAVDVRAAGQGESEDRTSLRGMAVNPWPRWLSLQGGGGRGGGKRHLEVHLVQGHMMAGRGGGEVSNLVFVCSAFLPPPQVLPLRTGFERQDNVKGKWLILWAI